MDIYYILFFLAGAIVSLFLLLFSKIYDSDEHFSTSRTEFLRQLNEFNRREYKKRYRKAVQHRSSIKRTTRSRCFWGLHKR